MPFVFRKLEIPEVILVEPKAFGDERGFFVETYKYSDFKQGGIPDNFVQDNHSKSIKGVLRGLHYQNPPKAQAKLIRCTQGEIFDVGVDIRKGSPTYGKWVGAVLNSENKHMLYVPTGFAHGFIVLSDTAEVMYKTSDEYSQKDEGGIRWDDPLINITWNFNNPMVSAKDAILPFLESADNQFVYNEDK